jgi:TP901 family phage tail tape measure protein
MSEQGFSVRLSARIDGYLAAMESAKRATKDLADSGHVNLDRLGGKMQDAGITLSKSVTLPLIAAGGMAIKMSSDFESAFARMVGLAGVTADEVDGLKKSVLDLAGETGQAPQDLADGLYFLRSSGLDAGKAMDALKVSARASAAGLGSTAVIADAVSSAMNAYAKSGLTAAEATDTLVATARAGKAEPAELAGALGRVLPIASELGITFKDVGGAIAALSLTGNDASQSATLLTNIMSKMLKPSQQGADALAAVGMSATSIRESIADKGLLATLEDLRTRLGDSGFNVFLEDQQAVQGALSLTGQNAEGVRATFDTVRDSVGATNEAFDAMAGTSGFKMKKAWTDLQVAMIQAGDIIMPIAAGIADGVALLATGFSELPSPVKTIVVGFLALVAAAGPLLIVGGSLVKNFNQIKTTINDMSGAASKASITLGAIGVVIGVASILYGENARHKQALTDATDLFTAALKREAEGQQGAVKAQIAAMITPEMVANAKNYGLSVSELADVISGKSVPAFEALAKSQEKKGSWWDPRINTEFDAGTSKFVNSINLVTTALANAKDQTAVAAQVTDELGLSTQRTAEQIATQTDNYNNQRGILGGLTTAFGATQLAAELTAYAVNRFAEEIAGADLAYRQLTGSLDEQEAWDKVNTSIADFGKNTKASAADVRGITRDIADYVAHTDTIPAEKKTEILAALRAGDIAEAERQLADLTVTREIYLKLTGPGAVTAAGYGPLSGTRAEGGPVLGGGRYLVGERGPEVLEMAGPGWVHPNSEVASAVALMSRGSMVPAAQFGFGGGPTATASVPATSNSVNFYGGINNTTDMMAAWQQANFALISAA